MSDKITSQSGIGNHTKTHPNEDGHTASIKIPKAPNITKEELEEAKDWLLARGLLWHPRVIGLSPAATYSLARIAAKNPQLAKKLLENRAIEFLRYGNSKRQDALRVALETLENLVRRNIKVNEYFGNFGLLDNQIYVVRGVLAEMFYVAELAALEGKRGYPVVARSRRNVPWDLIPKHFNSYLRERFELYRGLKIDGGAHLPITEADAVVSGDRLVEVKVRSGNRSILHHDDDPLSNSGDFYDFLNPVMLLAVAKGENLRGVEMALIMKKVDEDWRSVIERAAADIGIGMSILLFNSQSGEPQVIVDTMRPQALRGSSILFSFPPLPTTVEKEEGLDANDRAWFTRWIPDEADSRKSAEKSRHFLKVGLLKYAKHIAAGIEETLRVHYEDLLFFHLFDGDGDKLMEHARFISENAGSNSSPEFIKHMLEFGLDVMRLTKGDEDLLRIMERLQDYAEKGAARSGGDPVATAAKKTLDEAVEEEFSAGERSEPDESSSGDFTVYFEGRKRSVRRSAPAVTWRGHLHPQIYSLPKVR